MKHSVIVIAAFMVLLAVFSSGCTSNTAPAPAATTVPTTAATTAPVVTTIVTTATAAPVTTEDRSTQVMPDAQTVHLELSKDRPTSEIHLLYQGGPGLMFTQKIAMRVYDATGKYTEYVMNDGKKPVAGNEIIAKGTRGGDRCTVFVTSAGTTYKTMDETLYSDI